VIKTKISHFSSALLYEISSLFQMLKCEAQVYSPYKTFQFLFGHPFHRKTPSKLADL
jgi:hypothetical protein